MPLAENDTFDKRTKTSKKWTSAFEFLSYRTEVQNWYYEKIFPTKIVWL